MNFKAVAVAFCRHLWDLSEELVALAVSEDNADNRIKKTMVENLEMEELTSNAIKKIWIEEILKNLED
jgi:hypothetical protein